MESAHAASSGNKPGVVTVLGETGSVVIGKEAPFIAVIDSHMHIQSGHVGTMPFALGARLPFSVREKSLDIPFEKLYALLKREYIDENFVNLYEKKYQPFMYDLASKTEVLAKKVRTATSDIPQRKKRVQKLIFTNAMRLCKLIKTVFTNYENSLDAEQKMVTDIMVDNMRGIERIIERGEYITAESAATIHLGREVLNEASAQVRQRADKLTGVCIAIATYIVDFQLALDAGVFEFGNAILGKLKAELQVVVNNVIDIFEQITSLKKITASTLMRHLIQIIIESAKEVADFVEMEFSLAENAGSALHSQLSELSEILDSLVTIGIGQFLLIQKDKTYSIANKAVSANAQSLIAMAKEAGVRGDRIFAPMIALTMDLDFAHLDRFNADFEKAKVYRYTNVRYWLKINPVQPPALLSPELPQNELQRLRKNNMVQEERGNFYYFHSRLSGVKPGKLFWVHPSEYKVYEYWKIQRDDTVKSANNNPWRIVPLYHFEPRRYWGDCEEAFKYIMSKKDTSGSGTEPRIFIGVKLYPNLGYKPLDPRLPSLDTMYRRCCENEIPVMTHGSPGGAFTHDRPLYYEYDLHTRTPADVPVPDLSSMQHIDKETFYFMQEYASPYAWEKVLMKYPSLRLCIAHFGGDYDRPDSTDKQRKPLSGWNVAIDPQKAADNRLDTRYWNQKIISMMKTYSNLYTDLSCYEMNKNAIIQNLSNAIIGWPDLRKRILFGTDWYMTELSDLSYAQFVGQMKEAIDRIDANIRRSLPEKDPPLWRWITEINPFRFYRFDRIAKEYTKEIVRSIQKDDKIDKQIKLTKIEFAEKQKPLIYAIARKLKKMGELPDAVTGD